MAIVFIPAPLRRLTAGNDRVTVAGETVGALIDAIDARHAGFRERVVADGELLPSVAVAVDGDMITQGLAEPVRPDSEVHFVPALGGGRGTRRRENATSRWLTRPRTPAGRARRRDSACRVRRGRA